MYLVIFDCDGTIVDSQRVIIACMEQAFAAAELPAPSREAILSVVGLSLEQAVAAIAPDLDLPRVQDVTAKYKSGFAPLRADPAYAEPLFAGAREALDALHAQDDVLLGIATGKSVRGVKHLLDEHDWHGRFVTIQTADTSPSKPHPDMVLKAMAETGVEKARTVLIGDTSYDMKMARAAGVGAIGVSWGYHPVEELHGSGAHHVLQHFHELAPLLNRHWERGPA